MLVIPYSQKELFPNFFHFSDNALSLSFIQIKFLRDPLLYAAIEFRWIKEGKPCHAKVSIDMKPLFEPLGLKGMPATL
jgi:hypothetical protein